MMLLRLTPELQAEADAVLTGLSELFEACLEIEDMPGTATFAALASLASQAISERRAAPSEPEPQS